MARPGSCWPATHIALEEVAADLGPVEKKRLLGIHGLAP
jgi:hypothetical protein